MHMHIAHSICIQMPGREQKEQPSMSSRPLHTERLHSSTYCIAPRSCIGKFYLIYNYTCVIRDSAHYTTQLRRNHIMSNSKVKMLYAASTAVHILKFI